MQSFPLGAGALARPPLGDPSVASEAVRRVVARVEARAAEVVSESLYHERKRLDHADGARAEADRGFQRRVRAELGDGSGGRAERALAAIVERYAREIHGHFDPKVYALATRALPVGLGALLGSVTPARLVSALAERKSARLLDDHLSIEGEVDSLRALVGKGTVVLAPSHSSNLDSPLMGYAIYRLGLPPFAYGAGLNLFSSKVLGYFMDHLGAYTVDRQKADPLYKEVLKEYAAVSIEAGQNNLFFPGGTRSRSGAIEDHLKKGLLGAALAAYRNNVASGRARPGVFIVPATISYPLVLEAESLVADYLEESAKGRMLARDESDEPRRWIDFLRHVLALDVEVHLRIGEPLDPIGNAAGADGIARDARGRAVDSGRYFLDRGAVVEDAARDAEYTRIAASRVARAYRRDNVALSTSIVAFAALEALRRARDGGASSGSRRDQDALRVIGRIGAGDAIPRAKLEALVSAVLVDLAQLEREGGIRLGAREDAAGTVSDALRTFATYHTRPVLFDDGEGVKIGDGRLLLFYRNRLEGYGLLGAPALLPARAA